MEVNNMNHDQSAPKEAVWSGPYCMPYRHGSKYTLVRSYFWVPQTAGQVKISMSF